MSSRIPTRYDLMRTKTFHSIGNLRFMIRSYASQRDKSCIPAMIFDVGQTVGFLIFNTDCQKFILVSRIQFAMLERGVSPRYTQLEIASGRIEAGEDSLSAAVRECEYLSGYYPKKDNIKLIGHFDVSPAFLTERMTIYFIRVSNSDKRKANLGIVNEEIKMVELLPDQISDLKYENMPITDMKTCLSIQWWLLNHKVAKMLD